MSPEDLTGQIAALVERQRTDALPQEYRPWIGVPMGWQPSQYKGALPGLGVDTACAQAVSVVGGRILPIPPWPFAADADPFEEVWPWMRMIDGLILPGNIRCPAALCSPQYPQFWQEWWAKHLAQIWTILGGPLLGIGEGAEIWNEVLGGGSFASLHDQWPKEKPKLLPHADRDGGRTGKGVRHVIQVVAVSRLGRYLGRFPLSLDVVSMHQSGFERVGSGLRACAWAADGTVAALERIDERFFGLAFQDNPERTFEADGVSLRPWCKRVFQKFVAASWKYASIRDLAEWNALRPVLERYLRSRAVANQPLLPSSPQLGTGRL